jgi:Na+/H+ antiporter NhaD/arsenite permease-like protein
MTAAAIIFALTYLVIGLQRIPRLHLGRPAGALLGAAAMVAWGVIDFEAVERRILGFAHSARGLLWLVVLSSGLLAALFMNDTICLMLTPVVVRVTRRLSLPPGPYLIALATASNIGSVATIIVFETARRDGVHVGFLEYFKVGAPLTLATLALAWAVLALR